MDFSPSPSPLLKPSFPSSPFARPPAFRRPGSSTSIHRRGAGLLVKCSAAGHCEYGSSSSSLNTPYEPRSSTGISLTSVLQNQRQIFQSTVADHLKHLDFSMESAFARMTLSSSSDEAFLHRRIAEMKEGECREGVEEAMYMLIVYRFSEMRVPLVPRLSSCVCNGRLEIWPSKTWELESLLPPPSLPFIRDHVASLVGLRPDASVNACWATTRIPPPLLFRAYADSLLFGYSLRPPSAPLFRRLASLLPFKRRRERPPSREAEAVMAMQSSALFGAKRGEEGAVISTSFSSLKRLVLEAVAFGSFLYDVEDYVGTLFKLDRRPPPAAAV